MKKKIYCYNCDRDVNALVVKQNNNYTIHNEEISVLEEVLKCPYCYNELFDENLNNSLYNIYNEYLKKYELSFEKFRDIRKYYNLSQEMFAKALGWSKRSIIRYENAESLPQKNYLSIYRSIANNRNEFLNILNKNKISLTNKEYFKIYNSVNTDLDLKTINVFLYVLKNNFLSKTQIMKNLFSIDFESYKMNNKSITSLIYAHGTYGPVIDKKDDYLDFLLKNNYIEMVNNEEDVILFKPAKECDISVFSKEEIIIMNKVLKVLKGKSASKLTHWSHKFIGWINTKDGEKIDYSYSNKFELNNNW